MTVSVLVGESCCGSGGAGDANRREWRGGEGCGCDGEKPSVEMRCKGGLFGGGGGIGGGFHLVRTGSQCRVLLDAKRI